MGAWFSCRGVAMEARVGCSGVRFGGVGFHDSGRGLEDPQAWGVPSGTGGVATRCGLGVGVACGATPLVTPPHLPHRCQRPGPLAPPLERAGWGRAGLFRCTGTAPAPPAGHRSGRDGAREDSGHGVPELSPQW